MSHNNESSIYRNPNAPIEERTQDLLKKMTLKEKFASWTNTSVLRS